MSLVLVVTTVVVVPVVLAPRTKFAYLVGVSAKQTAPVVPAVMMAVADLVVAVSNQTSRTGHVSTKIAFAFRLQASVVMTAAEIPVPPVHRISFAMHHLNAKAFLLPAFQIVLRRLISLKQAFSFRLVGAMAAEAVVARAPTRVRTMSNVPRQWQPAVSANQIAKIRTVDLTVVGACVALATNLECATKQSESANARQSVAIVIPVRTDAVGHVLLPV